MNAMRLRFTIRDLLWLTLVVAMGLGWYVGRNHFNSELLAKDEMIRELRLHARVSEIPGVSSSLIEPLPEMLSNGGTAAPQ